MDLNAAAAELDNDPQTAAGRTRPTTTSSARLFLALRDSLGTVVPDDTDLTVFPGILTDLLQFLLLSY